MPVQKSRISVQAKSGINLIRRKIMQLPNQVFGVQRQASASAARSAAGIFAQQRRGRIQCATGSCINGRRRTTCMREIIECIPGSPGSPELGIPPGPDHCFVSGFEVVSESFEPCFSRHFTLVNVGNRLARF